MRLKYISGQRAFFIGITEFDNDGVWTLYGTEVEAPILDFNSGEEMKQEEYCAVMDQFYSFQWANVECSKLRPTVCEIE